MKPEQTAGATLSSKDHSAWLTALSNGQLHGIVNTHKINGEPLREETVKMATEILKYRGEQTPALLFAPLISADAQHIARCAREAASQASGRIVKHLWIIFVCLPVVMGILFAIVTAK